MEGERTRGLFRVAAMLVIVASSLVTASCAPPAPYNPDRLPPAQMSRIGEICHRVMGLPAGLYTQYQACQESLSHALAARREVDAKTGAQASTALDAPLPATAARSYFSASNDEVDRREREACAAIGLDPATREAAQCVVDLAGNLFDADNPIWRD